MKSDKTQVLIATKNRGKLKEMKRLLADLPVRLQSLNDFSGVVEAEETGATFTENAVLKARSYAMQTGLASLADDSGLEVEALGGAPGIFSARWAGPAKDFSAAMRLIEEKLQRLGATAPERRRAHFVCVLALATPEGATEPFEGRVAGTLVWPPRGDLGFGYDPIFLP
ncbi:MAG: non-canonical purine NTP pyrophosphatase, partial [Acidobacteria bacterium]|nr:non-canonical purine NTP pyrophosphatase [Acidobacteriota bacterium]